MSTVTVTLDRADAETWLGYYREHRLTGWERRCRDALAVALDRDREELVERIAALLTLEDTPWDETGVTERLWCRDRAARILAALDETSGEAGPAPKGGGLDEARQGGEGPVGKGLGSSPKLESRRWAANESRQGCDEIRRELSGTSDGPVRAASAGAAAGAPPEETGSGEATAEAVVPPADLIDRAVNAIEWTCNCDREDLDLHLAVRRCAPLLIAHGREQERARWKARIERLADELDLEGDVDTARAARETCMTGWQSPLTAVADDLRSLLAEEGENGE